MRAPSTALMLLVVMSGGVCAVAPTLAQDSRPSPSLPQDRTQVLPAPKSSRPEMPAEVRAVIELRRRLIELDRLMNLGSTARAEGLLNELAQHTQLERELIRRRVKLAQMKGDHAAAVQLCRSTLRVQPRNAGLWRDLTMSLLALDQPDTARLAVDNFMLQSPNLRSAAIVGVELFRNAARPVAVVSLIDSLRIVMNDDRFLGIERTLGLLATGRQEDAAREAGLELRANPFNLALLRTDLLQGPFRPTEHAAFVKAVRLQAESPTSQPVEKMLAASLLLARGDGEAALAQASAMVRTLGGVMQLLQNAVILLRELELLEDRGQVRVAADYLLAILARLSGPDNVDQGLRRRAADLLADACDKALTLDVLGRDPSSAADRYGTLLDLVRRANPASERLYAAQIRLATYTRDELQAPGVAAQRLEHLLLDLDLPSEGVALVRLSLGECYLAAGDTSRGRTVLTSLGRDPQFRKAAGHAHYHLARLDLAEGHFATARDRFAVVALDNPAAPYANDALELGLAVAEEMDNPTGGPDILTLYAAAVYYDLMARKDERLEALLRFVTQAVQRVDLDEPQYLLERGRFELAGLLADRGQVDQALAQIDVIVSAHPDGRYPAAALEMRGRLLSDQGRPDAARRAWERLLAQYPEYLFIDDVRDELRTLPN